MRTKLLLSAGVLILAAAAPWIDGYIFRQNYTESLKNAQKYTESMRSLQSAPMKIAIVDYHEGWLSSDAKISFEFPAETDSQGNSYKFVFDEHIIHGPVVFNPLTNKWMLAQGIIKFNVHLPVEIETLILGSNTTKGILEVVTVAGFDGSYHATFNMPSINRSLAGNTVKWDGLTGTSDIQMPGRILKRVQSDIQIGAVTANGSMGSLSIQPIALKYDILPDDSGLWNGGYQLDLSKLSANIQGKSLELGNFQFSDTSNVVGVNYNNQLKLSLGQFVIPEYSLSNSDITCSLQSMNAAALAAFLKNVENLPSMNQMTQEQHEQFIANIPSLISPAMRVGCDTNINASFGKATANITVGWPDGVKTLDDVEKNVNVKLNARIAVSFVNKVIELMNEGDASDQTAASTAPAATAPTPAQPTEADLLNQIDTLVKQGAVAVDVGEQLKDLEQTHLAPNIFAQNINSFVVRKDVTQQIANQLIQAYNAVDNAKKHPVAASQPTEQPSASPADQMKQQINAYLKAGYITQDKDDYVITITLEKGVVSANGHVLQNAGG